MLVKKEQLVDLIPHGSKMCLIDCVIDLDESSILCKTSSHKSTDNPLSQNNQLSTVLLIEYAAQAAAIHSALNQQELVSKKPAYIGSVKNIHLYERIIPNNDTKLNISCHCLISNSNGAIYEFEASCNNKLADGQINLLLSKKK